MGGRGQDRIRTEDQGNETSAVLERRDDAQKTAYCFAVNTSSVNGGGDPTQETADNLVLKALEVPGHHALSMPGLEKAPDQVFHRLHDNAIPTDLPPFGLSVHAVGLGIRACRRMEQRGGQ